MRADEKAYRWADSWDTVTAEKMADARAAQRVGLTVWRKVEWWVDE